MADTAEIKASQVRAWERGFKDGKQSVLKRLKDANKSLNAGTWFVGKGKIQALILDMDE